MDDAPPPSGATSVMVAPVVDMRETRRMAPPAPREMGGFILKKRPAQSETPTFPIGNRSAGGKGWTTLAIGIGVGVLVLWVVLVVVLRALLR